MAAVMGHAAGWAMRNIPIGKNSHFQSGGKISPYAILILQVNGACAFRWAGRMGDISLAFSA
jgi:hypothetical protein